MQAALTDAGDSGILSKELKAVSSVLLVPRTSADPKSVHYSL
jgi:hypothetical protein